MKVCFHFDMLAYFLIFISLLLPLVSHAESGAVFTFTGSGEDRLGVHTTYPNTMSTHFQSIYLEQRFKSDHWSGTFSGRAWNESAYANSSNDYPTNLIQKDSQDISLRDFYIQYKTSDLFFRAGNQQVVWGEAFGFFYSDIVNPKDLRDGGFRDFEAVRRPLPMLNLKYTRDWASLQGIYVVKPFYNINPLPGSDFAPYNSQISISQLNIVRTDSDDIKIGNDEYGGRLSLTFLGLDTSFFVFSYNDRSPYYAVDASTQLPKYLALQELHSRVVSSGLTASLDLSGFVVRFEGLKTLNRIYPLIATGFGGVPSLSNFSTSETVYVFGVDAPTFEKFNLGVQYSNNHLDAIAPGLLRTQDQTLLSIRLSRFFGRQSSQIVYGNETSDQGNILQFEHLIPIGNSLEFKFGVDVFDGPNTSQFGQIRRASRAYSSFKFFFKG
jgi:hypothetical protein